MRSEESPLRQLVQSSGAAGVGLTKFGANGGAASQSQCQRAGREAKVPLVKMSVLSIKHMDTHGQESRLRNSQAASGSVVAASTSKGMNWRQMSMSPAPSR